MAVPPVHLDTKPVASGWLSRFNEWRASVGVSQLTENTTWSTGDYDHSVYMVKNNLITHYETTGTPYYTTDGDAAARNGNLYVSSSTATTDEQAIDWWMQAPFHSMGMLDPRLSSTGFGSYREVKSGWDMGATVDTLRGNSFTGGTYPVYFPGNGTVVPLGTYGGGEFPDPLQACPGYAAPTGLPVWIQIGGNVATSVTAHSFTANGVSLPHCVIDSSNPSVGSNLTYRGGAILIPQAPLSAGVGYTVNLTVNGVAYKWSFGVDATGAITTPMPAGWTPVGGVSTSGVAASSWGSSRVDIFVRGQDNALWQRTWTGSWNAWHSLGGVITASPAAVSWGPNRIDVFVRGQDNAMYHLASDGTNWSGWEAQGGYLTSSPAVSSWASGRLDVFVRGGDNALWHKYWAGFWGSWGSLGGVLASDPAALSSTTNRIDVFARGQDSALWQRSWTGTTWTSWTSDGGILTAGPAVSSCGAGKLDVFVVGQDHALYQSGFNGAWSTWQRSEGYWIFPAGVVCPPGTTTVNIYEVTVDGSVGTFTAPGT